MAYSDEAYVQLSAPGLMVRNAQPLLVAPSAHACTVLSRPVRVFQPETPALKLSVAVVLASVLLVWMPEPRLFQVEASVQAENIRCR